MGAPKQKWTAEEEAALKAGINKYGAGRWSAILKDQEFSPALRSRSNVDLKDKFRNMNCMANGIGSRHKASSSHKNSQVIVKRDNDDDDVIRPMIIKDSQAVDATPVATTAETSHETGSGKQSSRLDDLILEAVTKLKEPRGSSQHAIAQYIKEHHSMTPDSERNLATSLKLLRENGRIMKGKHRYSITPSSMTVDEGKHPSLILPNRTTNDLSDSGRTGVTLVTKIQIDAELENMRNMTAEEAVAVAAQAVAEAEAAIAEAEVAAKEAEEAEAEAETAQCFADAAINALNRKIIRV